MLNCERLPQINGAFGPKLKELELTGTQLHTLTLDAFEGIEGHELMLVVRGTSLRELPANFIDMFANVAHFSLDLRDNRLRHLGLGTLYNETQAGPWEWTGTRILKGTVRTKQSKKHWKQGPASFGQPFFGCFGTRTEGLGMKL